MSSAGPRRAEGDARRPWGLWGLRGAVVSYLAMMIAVPLLAVLQRGFSGGLRSFWHELANPIAFDAFKLTVLTAAITAAVNLVMGTLTAFVLTRYEFPGRRVLDRLVDMPFAIPTLVTGVMLVVLLGPSGVLGGWLEARHVSVIFAKPGIVLALLFVTYPFVIRTVQPVLLEAERIGGRGGVHDGSVEVDELPLHRPAGDFPGGRFRGAPLLRAVARGVRLDRGRRGEYPEAHPDRAGAHLRRD